MPQREQEITLLRTEAHESKNTPAQHLERFYKTFAEIRHGSFDGMIVTGAPVEHLPFEDVDYWHELLDIMNYASSHVYSTLYICWAAQAALYHFYGIPKYTLPSNDELGVTLERRRVLDAADAFVWQTEPPRFEPVPRVNRVEMDLLQGIDRVRDRLLLGDRAAAEAARNRLAVAFLVRDVLGQLEVGGTGALVLGAPERLAQAPQALGERAGERAAGSVAASDAFFPFADGVEALAAAGARAVIQPGGSMRDAEVIAAADRLGLAMVFTGQRHFRH